MNGINTEQLDKFIALTEDDIKFERYNLKKAEKNLIKIKSKLEEKESSLKELIKYKEDILNGVEEQNG